jgi:hypothetical protein
MEILEKHSAIHEKDPLLQQMSHLHIQLLHDANKSSWNENIF